MLGLMMNQPLLISGQIEFAAKFHANTEVVTRAVEGPIRRSTYGQVSRRAKKLADSSSEGNLGLCCIFLSIVVLVFRGFVKR